MTSFTTPASFAQRRLWLLDQLDPGNVAYNVPWVLHLDGALDVEALRSALQAVVDRHEALRTVFAATGGEPVQVVQPSVPFDLPVADLAGGHEQRALSLATDLACRPFDLAGGPLLRAKLVRLAPQRHDLVLVLHHIVADGRSTEVIIDELSQRYEALVTGTGPHLAELPIQYGDHAAWQQERSRRGEFDDDLAYWTDHLFGAPTVFSLPTDRSRPATQSHRGRAVPVRFDPHVVGDVRRLARTTGGTPFTVLLAAFACLLHRYTAAEDFLVGIPVSGRTHPQSANLVGMFVNTLAIRCRPRAAETFAAFLDQVRDTTFGALGHQDTPFEQIVDLLQPERSLAYGPVVQVFFGYNRQAPRFIRGGLRWTSEFVDNGTTKFDLHLALAEDGTDTGLSGELISCADLFDDGIASAMAAAYQILLREAAADPDRPVGALPLLSGAERGRALSTGNDTARDVPESADPGLAVERLRATRGDDIAVVSPDTRLTFRQLADDANRLAQLLSTRGVGPDTPVAVCLDRSAALVVVALALWQAGAAYLPLDPELPDERLRLMLTDARVRHVVTHRAVRHRLAGISSDGISSDIVCLDEDADELAAQPATAPRRVARPEHLAYLRYTSGSTGQPKGVAVHRGAVMNLLAYLRDELRLTPEDRWLSVTTPAFDISTAEHLLPPLVGARAVLAGQDETADPVLLRRRMVDERISVLQATPTTWRMLATAGGAPAAVRVRITGGEAVQADVMDEMLRDGAAAWDGYGPTETSVYSAFGRMAGMPARLGPPVANTRLYVLDPRGEPVPAGVVGELYVGGLSLARGYLHRPELTAERFVADPYGVPPGDRLYRTGDLVRRCADGRLAFVGRADQQVKVRGFRVELGEIETLLRGHPAVDDAAVALTTGQDPRLVAYVVPADVGLVDGPGALWPDLRAHLAVKLPDYMVPATMMALDTLPRTGSGKLDRSALPAPDWTATRDTGFEPPRTATERTLAGIWTELLGVDAVGLHDNFFALGGHSLSATELVARIRTTFGTDLPLRALFAGPTVGELAEALDLGDAAMRPASDVLAGLDVDDLLTELIAEEGG